MTPPSKEKQSVMVNTPMIDTSPKKVGFDVSFAEKDLIIKYIRSWTSGINKLAPKHDTGIEIKTLNSNFFYNSYSIAFREKNLYHKYILKISIDKENEKLKREKDVLLELAGKRVAPSVISYSYNPKKNTEYLLTIWENGHSFDYYGDSDFMYNLGTFASVLDVIHETYPKNLQSFKQRFEENESILSLKEIAESREIKIFEKLAGLTFEDLESIFLKIRQDFLSQYTEDIPVLCHSNLKHSNILYKNNHIKVINFENSHVADIYYSLLKCVNNTYMFYSDKKTKLFLSKYHQYSALLGDIKFKTFQNTYESKKELNRMLLFQDLLCKIIFHCFTYGPFARKKFLNHYMYLYMNLKPTICKFFPDYKESFDKLFFMSAPNIKTYDVEELRSLFPSKEFTDKEFVDEEAADKKAADEEVEDEPIL